jgi:hypothetical protein
MTDSLKLALEQCKADNDMLLQKVKVLTQKTKALETELLERERRNNSTLTLPKINNVAKQRLTEE